MKDGYKVIDMDTHVDPTLEDLEKYMDPDFRPRLAELEPYRRVKELGEGKTSTTFSFAPAPYNRTAGQPYEPEQDTPVPGGQRTLFPVPQSKTGLAGHHRILPRPGSGNTNPENRVLDMADEGRDVDFMFGTAAAGGVQYLNDPTLSEGFFKAYHRFMHDFSADFPDKLKSHALVPANDVEWAISELKSLAKEPWLTAVWPQLPGDMPIDDPSLEPLWATMNDLNLPMIHHSFFVDFPWFPGYRDLWGYNVAARTAAHVWGAQRLCAFIICSGMLDRYPNINIAMAECGHGWLPQWVIRLGEMIYYTGQHTTPPMDYKPIEYVQMGRFMCTTEPMEGAAMTKACFDLLGDNWGMHQSDYPHGEAHFPDTAGMIIDWPIWEELGEETLRKHMAGNAEKYLRLA